MIAALSLALGIPAIDRGAAAANRNGAAGHPATPSRRLSSDDLAWDDAADRVAELRTLAPRPSRP